MDIELGVFDVVNENKSAYNEAAVCDVKVSTSFGSLAVTVVGDRRKPAMLTYHDIGLNASSQFWGFFGFSDMAAIAERYCVYHVNAPGQEDDAESYSLTHIYPTFDDLAHQLNAVVEHFEIKNFIGVGVGAGGNILMRFALNNTRLVEALVLINSNCTQAGWVEWGYQKVNIYHLKSRGMTNVCVDYLMWQHFGRNLDQFNTDLILSFKQYFSRLANPINLACFIESYIQRSDLEITREDGTLSCPVLNICGSLCPHVNDTVDLNSKLNPTNSTWLKITDQPGLVLESCPDKVTEAVILFLQGLGHLTNLSYTQWKKTRLSSVEQIPKDECESFVTLRLRDTEHVEA